MRVTLRTNGVVFAFVYLTIGETPEMTRILKMPHPKKIYSVVFFFFSAFISLISFCCNCKPVYSSHRQRIDKFGVVSEICNVQPNA